MIVLQVHSGLGNQLFMYAAARALAERRNTSLCLDVDTDCRDGVDTGQYVGHSFQLDKFRIKADFLHRMPASVRNDSASASGVLKLKAQLRNVGVVRKAVRLLRYQGVDITSVAMKVSGTDKRFFREARGDWGYKPEFLDLPDDTILRGCFFSYKYFDWMRDALREELSLKAELSPRGREVEHQILNTNSVSLHIRRGDVVTNPEYRSWYEGIVTETYFRNAISYMQEHVREPHFFVFSDEIAWVKTHLAIPGKVTYVDHNGPEGAYEDLHLMSRCKHNVTCGFSSFSWWAAYLNSNPDKIVLRTRRMNALPHLDRPEDFYPADWVVVES
ncbi:MAG TPA: alpha-1,2-fucosyltransferase [Noviherbaspirillum sp.]|nr:alpha-1,2-fucosyltransferase [Noviherbaspirillum sp.]